MKQNTKASFKLLAIVIAFSFFSLFLSENDIRGADNNKVYPHRPYFGLSDYGICVAVNIESTEELVPLNFPKITRYQNSRGIHNPKSFVYYLKNNLIFLLTAFILYAIIRFYDNDILYCRRYIIKYIHDQNGPKD